MNTQNLEIEVTDYLDSRGFKARNIRGFNFIRTAVILCIENPELLGNVTKKLYPAVADKYNTTASRVERAIRHAIGLAYVENKPTNSEFIALVADDIRLNNLKEVN